jgi:hypothetical protein
MTEIFSSAVNQNPIFRWVSVQCSGAFLCLEFVQLANLFAFSRPLLNLSVQAYAAS